MTKFRRDFDITKLTLLLAASLCLVVAGAAQADLTAFTGNPYTWVSYNNGLSLYPTLPANVTGICYDNDQTGAGYSGSGGVLGVNTYGSLIDFSDGSDTDADMVMSNNFGPSGGEDPLNPSIWHDGPQSGNNGSSYVWVCGNAHPLTTDVIFADTLGASISGYGSDIHGDGSHAAYTFSGLDVNATYDFAGIAEANATGNWVATSQLNLFAGDVVQTTVNFDWNDRVLFEGLTPNSDGTISIGLTNISGVQNWFAPAFSGIALGEVIPEPATMSLLAIGGVMALVRRRRK